MRDLTRELGVGTCCGKCVPEAKETLFACLDAHRESAGCAAARACFPQPSTEFAV